MGIKNIVSFLKVIQDPLAFEYHRDGIIPERHKTGSCYYLFPRSFLRPSDENENGWVKQYPHIHSCSHFAQIPRGFFYIKRQSLCFAAVGLRVERKATSKKFKKYFLTSQRLCLSCSAPWTHTYQGDTHRAMPPNGKQCLSELILCRSGSHGLTKGNGEAWNSVGHLRTLDLTYFRGCEREETEQQIHQ